MLALVTAVKAAWVRTEVGITYLRFGSDDWFEIYNPTGTSVDLTGWALTDSLNNPTQFMVPAGYHVSAAGFLLVWADGEPGQNSTNRADLHVNFKLGKNGEAIGVHSNVAFSVVKLQIGPGMLPAALRATICQLFWV